MNTPRGLQTTELWLQVLTIGAILGMSILGFPVTPALAAILIGGSTAYGVNRTWAKRPPVVSKDLADRIDKAFKRS